MDTPAVFETDVARDECIRDIMEQVSFLVNTVNDLLASMNRMPAPIRAMLNRKVNPNG